EVHVISPLGRHSTWPSMGAWTGAWSGGTAAGCRVGTGVTAAIAGSIGAGLGRHPPGGRHISTSVVPAPPVLLPFMTHPPGLKSRPAPRAALWPLGVPWSPPLR